MDGVNMKVGIKRGVGQKHGALRETLIKEGLELLDSQGVEAVTIRAVARNAGVAHSAPANHFPSREAMLTAIAIYILSELACATEKFAKMPFESRENTISAFADIWFEFAFKLPHRYQLLWRRDLVDHNNVGLESVMNNIYQTVLSLLYPEREAHIVDPETHAIALWSMLHGYISLRLARVFIEASDSKSGLPREQAILKSLIYGVLGNKL